MEYWVVGGCNQHVVHVYRQPAFSYLLFEYSVHHCLEGGGGVGETEEHDRRFVQPIICDEGSLPLVAFFDTHVVVTPANVELGEQLLHPYSVDQLGNER